MKKIIHISVWVILVAGLFVILGFAERQHQSLICGNLDILIQYNSDDYFITVDDVNAFFTKKGLKIKGAPLSDIDAGEIEAALYSTPYVENADVYISIDGDVNIRIIQKTPIVKVFNKTNHCFYIDDKGRLMQESGNYSARLLIANGFINEGYNPYTKLDVNNFSGVDTVMMKTSIYKVFRMAQFINHDDFWKAMVDEIFINNKGEMELFTKIGNQTIVFGDIDNMGEKFDNLLVFYKQVLNKIGWSKYKTINLKYKNQVVCSKI
jgi:cell division protein FtsQ